MSMNPGVKAQWIADLRSGKYEQGKHRLHRGGKFCCLGVLCEQAAGAGIVTRDDTGVSSAYRATGDHCDFSTISLPLAVMTWAGLASDDPPVWASAGKHASLASLNDSDMAFSAIADIIEEQL